MQIQLAETEEQIRLCYPVVHQLRTHLSESDFVRQVREQQGVGYQLAYLAISGRPVAVAGFRLTQCLAWGRFLYVDDLVTLASQRSRGHGAELLRWLQARARAAGCSQLHLDSGVEKRDAHRFYEREGMEKSSFHYSWKLG